MSRKEINFVDEARIRLRAGDGGNGIIHFRREKHVPLGGPDGGDGGHGGSIVLVVEQDLNTLLRYQRVRDYKAQSGGHGGGNNKTGRSGRDLEIFVPPGTIACDADTGIVLGDLTNPGHRLQIAVGGSGGRGNSRFRTSSNRAPRIAEKGSIGQIVDLSLELRLIADVGIVGVPNAGKSTLLSSVTAAKPKIDNYPFTTLNPNLGVADLGDYRTLVLADIPGLIEGAHAGVGLGAAFLRHIQRTRVIIHLLDGMSEDPLYDFNQIMSELALYDSELVAKPQIVALNKIDLPEVSEKLPLLESSMADLGYELQGVSAIAHIGIKDLLQKAALLSKTYKEVPIEEEEPVYRTEVDPSSFEITREIDGNLRITGERIERAAQSTYWEYDDAVLRFQNIIDKLGIRTALEENGVRPGDKVRIGPHELEWVE
jgi:GTP-binding protein